MNIGKLNDKNPIKIGYYDPFDVYPLIRDELIKYLPLTNLHIKLNSNPTKTINKLPVDLFEEVPKKDQYNNTHPENVYLRLMFIKIDSLDKYRNQVRPLIREWLKNLVFKLKTSWMIIFYQSQESKESSSLIKTSYFDKLQKDFGVDGKELDTILPNSTSSLTSGHCFKYRSNVNEFIIQLKITLINAFISQHDLFNEWIKTRKSNSFERLIAVYKLGELFNEMRLFQESNDIFNELESEIDNVAQLHPDLLNYDIDIDQFEIDKFEQKNLKESLYQETINLFDLKCLIFINQSLILQKLAINLTNSVGSKHICKLYQKLMIFLNLIQRNTSLKFAEFEYRLIDYYLNLPILSQKFNTEDSKELIECKAELKLFQRSIVCKIGNLNGIYIYQLQYDEISLEETKEQKPENKSTLFKDKSAYRDRFESITEDVIKDFLICNRSKSIDVLSIDLALLNFDKANYQQCLDILDNSYDFFIDNGWKFLGGILLEIYLKCIEETNPENTDEILKTCLKLLSILNSNSNFNAIRLIKDKSQVEKLYTKINQYSLDQESVIECSLSEFFKTDLVPYISADEESNKDEYYIELEVLNSFGIKFNFLNVKLVVINDEGTEMTFSINDVELDAKAVFKLVTNHFVIGSFAPLKLSIHLNEKLKLVLDYGKKDIQIHNASFNDTGIENNTTREKISTGPLLAYQNLKKFRANFQASNIVKLGTSNVVLKIENKNNEIRNVVINLGSTTAGLTLENSVLKLEKLEGNERKDFNIPYTYTSDDRIINVRATITYKLNDENYSFMISYDIDTNLSISVSVQDIFKQDFIYSKFQIGTSNSKFPIKMLNYELTNENYEIESPMNKLDEIVLFGEQPASIFYKIKPKENYKATAKDVLQLVIDYRNLQDECELYLFNHIFEKLQAIELTKYWYLIKDIILLQAKFDLNNYAINDSLKLVNDDEFISLSNKIINQYIPLGNQKSITDILQSSVKNTNDINITSAIYDKNQLIIDVAKPVLKYLQVIEYKHEKQMYIVGEPINVELQVKTITKWSLTEEDQPEEEPQVLASSSPTRNGNNTHSTSEFQISLQNDDNWLISGFKRYTFKPVNDNIVKLDLILIPLNIGKILLPKILIKNLNNDGYSSIDIEFKNGNETMLIVPEVNNITFSF
ncbi:unnamed protein product [Candida verbasci]|uniref:Trafficking protein particle complex II-specific subunit 130 n=1 Tax=Candida verbasci TaxID=1227364 RepID=A0A9W4TWX3_9ASCO|nr:unnamed protein product [Candida verbasci]